jgi:hypothetical protein
MFGKHLLKKNCYYLAGELYIVLNRALRITTGRESDIWPKNLTSQRGL